MGIIGNILIAILMVLIFLSSIMLIIPYLVFLLIGLVEFWDWLED